MPSLTYVETFQAISSTNAKPVACDIDPKACILDWLVTEQRIPPGVWYRFSCISDGPALLTNCTDQPLDPCENYSRPMDDPAIPYQWVPSN